MNTTIFNYSALTKVFQAIRKLGIVARQNFMCCGGCGHNAFHQERREGKLPDKEGYVFYHAQSTERLRSDGYVHIYFGSFIDGNDVSMMRKVVGLFAAAGFDVDWDGTDSQAPKISFTRDLMYIGQRRRYQ